MSIQSEFKRIDNILLEDAGTNGANDYITQISWILFLKYLDDLEDTRQEEAIFKGEDYEPIFKSEFQWDNWAAPKLINGKPDLNKQLVGDDLIELVNTKLFPYLKSFKNTVEDSKDIHYKIGEIFSEIGNKIQSGRNLREIIDLVDKMEFKTQDELDDLSALYEDRIKLLGGAGRSGEYYTPRPLIQAMIRAIDPKPGKTIYDGAAGSAGFLTESYAYLRDKAKTPSELRFLKEDTFYAKNKKPEPYLLGTMNMILHGIESPNMTHTNTLTEDTHDIQDKDRYDYILANPPFGGSEHAEIQRNFTIKTRETANLFLQHFMKKLRVGGEAAIVIKNTFLTNEPTGATGSIRKELLENFNLHTILDLPGGVFAANSSTGVKTVVLFFKKGEPTSDIFYYQLNLARNLGKTAPLNLNDMADFLEKYKTRQSSENSWTVNIANVSKSTYDLGVTNPNTPAAEALKTPKEILDDIKDIDREMAKILEEIKI
ncbi:DNA methyltransferase [Alphaproteobacteria bacterium]|nr:DNA methyltransferase [Alphaproteobacteria bacterium]